MIHATSYRLLDFVAALTDPLAVPIVSGAWKELEASRAAAFTAPWCHAVLRLLETKRMQDTQLQEESIAKELGITEQEVHRSLELLLSSGQIERHNGFVRVRQTSNVDLAVDPNAVQQLKAWAAEIGLKRINDRAEGLYSYNLFCVSERDYVELQQLHRQYYRQVRALVAESSPSERVVMLNLQTFALDSALDELTATPRE